MAVRSGAGTGVVVSLVVFIMTTVFLLILTIVFYAGKTKEQQAKTSAENALAVYVKNTQRNDDTFRGFEEAAKSRGESVTQHLIGRYEAVLGYAGGDPSGGLDRLKAETSRWVKEGDTMRLALQSAARDLSACQQENDGAKKQLEALSAQVADREAQLEQAKQSRQELEQAIETQIAQYRDSSEDYRKRVDEAVNGFELAKDELRSNYEGQVRDLQEEVDDANRNMVSMRGKIDQFERARADAQMKARNPAMLVDGRIIDAPGSSDQVFIDRGKRDRIVLGMTFEVYGDQAQIRVNPQTGEVPRGKASLQVIKVTDTTSTCKITRSVPGQPLVPGDVIANAVFDPNYKFRFLVHGKFDVDNDGKPTETEAEYLRSLVLEWGGTVISGEDLPGDLDFLVLGAEPPRPPQPATDATPVQLEAWVKQNAANEKYNQMFRQAREAQIPVLNANRFFILIGHTDR